MRKRERERKESLRSQKSLTGEKKIMIIKVRGFLLKTRCFVATFVRSTVSKRCMHAKNTFCYWVPERFIPFDLLSTSNVPKNQTLLINHRTLQRVTCSSTAFTHVCVHYSIDGNMENIVFLNLPSILWTNPFESWEANRAYRWKSRFSRLCCIQFPVLRDQIDAIHEFRNSEFQFSALQDRYAVFYDGYKVGTELPWEKRW